MAEATQPQPQKLTWKFPPTFWYANGAELCERFAFYGMFITLVRYLNREVGFTDAQAGIVSGWFSSLIYLFPTFMGIMADKIGFKQALIIAFTLLTGGYALLGAFQLKVSAILALTMIMLGGAIIKPVISGTVAKTSDALHRARAMSIFYMVVNIGSFSGKLAAGPLNDNFGLQYINFYAAGMSFIALCLVALFYRNPDIEGTGKTVGEAIRGLGRVLKNVRFDMLIIIIGGFWAIQGQLYSAMPTYIERLLGVQYKPEWLANINPLVVVILVVPITHLVRNFRPVNSIGIGLLIIPFTALVVALSPTLRAAVGDSIDLGVVSVHPMILMFIIGIGLQGLAECFLSPKWLEFASKQAPKGEVGLYLGYSHLTTCVSWLFAFILAGYLLAGFCPDPRTLPADVRAQWRAAIDPHYRFQVEPQVAESLAIACALPADVREKAAAAEIEIPPGLLPNDVREELERAGIDIPPGELPADVQARLAAQGVVVAAGAPVRQLSGADLEGQWKQQTVAAWQIEGEDDTYRILRTEFDIEREDGTKSWFDHLKDFFVTVDETIITEVLVISKQPVPSEQQPEMPSVYDRAHYIWWVFTAVGFAAFIGLLIFKFVTDRIDARRAAA